jgi:AsmA-like C-terminal region/AsmA family
VAAATASLPDVARLRAALIAGAALLLLAAWQVPQWLDWTRYRSTIEVLATTTLGQPVTITGPISLTLLPQPVLTAAQVNVGGNGPTDVSVHVDALRVRVALWPLIGGHVDARELVLRGPDLHLPWPAEPGMLRPRPPAWLASFAARIESGRLTIGRLAFTGIDATLVTLETGALSATGTAQFSGHDWHFTARLTATGPDGAAGLNATLDGQGKANGLGASFTGQLARDGTLVGAIASRGPNLAVLLPAPPVAFRADGRLTVGSGLAAADDLSLEIGGSPASGAVALRVAPNQRLDIALAASRLDLDAWLPVLLRAGTTVAGIEVPIGIDFSAESAPLGGGTLEHVRAAIDLTGNDLVVREASALLPGNGRLRLGGRVARGDLTRPRFDGDLRLDAPVLRTTLRWLEQVIPGTVPSRLLAGLPDGVAQRAELSAHVVAGRGEAMLQRLVGSLDDASISGSLGFKGGDPPAYMVDLSLDHVALEQWLPRLPGLAELSPLVPGLDAELRLNIRHATLADTRFDGLAVDAGIEAGGILLRRFEGTARGARVTASGVLGDGGRISDGKLSLETKDATPLADLLAPAWQATPALWHGPGRLDAQFAGPQEAVAVAVRLTLADAQLDASPVVDLKSGEWTTTLTLRHPGARRMVATLGLPERIGLRGLPDWLGDGSLSLVAHLGGGPGRFVADKFDLTAAALHATGGLAVDVSGAEPRVSGHVDTDAATLPLPGTGSDIPLPFGVLHGWRGDVRLGFGQLVMGAGPALHDASVLLSVANAALRLQEFRAKLGVGTVSGSLAFDAAAAPPSLAVQAKVSDAIITGSLNNAPIDLLSGRLDTSVQLAASGYSASALIATLGGRAALTVDDGAVAGFDLFRLKLAVEKSEPTSAEAAANEALRLGTTGFDRLQLGGNIAQGDLVLDTGRLISTAGDAHVSGGINLANQALDVTIVLQPAVPNPPEVAIHVTGTFDRPNRTPELAGLARWMAELVH